MPIEPMTLNIRLDPETPFVLSGGNLTNVNLQLNPSISGAVALTGPKGDPSFKGIGGFVGGIPLADEPVVVGIAPYDLTFTLSECKSEALVAATAITVFKIKCEGIEIGTITYGAGATVGTVAFTDSTVAKGELVTIVAPTTPDATLANITFLLASA
jgi:hypothetical protein